MGKGHGASSGRAATALVENPTQWLQQLQDSAALRQPHAYLRHWPLQRAGLLVSSALLEAPPSFKQYRGHAGVIQLDPGSAEQLGHPAETALWVGWTSYGKTESEHHGRIYISEQLEEVLSPVNRTLRSKQRKGYQPVADSGPDFLDSTQVGARMRQLDTQGLLGPGS